MQAALKALAAAAAPRCAGSARAYTAYITNERDNTVGVVDLDQTKTKTVLVGQRPHGITTGVHLAPVGTQNLGRNQVLNDKGQACDPGPIGCGRGTRRMARVSPLSGAGRARAAPASPGQHEGAPPPADQARQACLDRLQLSSRARAELTK